MNILDLFARIGLKTDQPAADKFLKSINSTKKELIGAIAGTLSLATAIRVVNDAMAEALGFKKFAAETGASVQELQKWEAVANQVSGAGQAVADSIKAISANQENIKLGKGNIAGYQLLGIDPRQDPFKILEKLREKTQGLSQGMKKNLLGQFGISADLISTLELTNAEFSKMAGQAWIIPQSSINGLNQTRGSLEGVKNMVNYLKTEIAARLAPTITKITVAIQKWARENKEGIIKGFQKAFEWIGRFVNMVIRAGAMIDRIVKSTIGWKAAMIAIASVLAVMNAGFLLSPIGLFSIAIIALIAILEDLYVYSKGGKSAFGHLMNDFPAMKGPLKDFLDSIGRLKDYFEALKNLDTSKIDLASGWRPLRDIIDLIVAGLKEIKQFIKDIKESANFGDFLGKMSKGGILDPEARAASGLQTRLLMSNPFAMAGPLTKAGATTQNVYFTIDGAIDPHITAKAVRDVLVKEFNRTQAQQNKGGKKE